MTLEIQATLNTDDLTCIMFDMDNTLFDLVEAKIHACREIVNYIDVEMPLNFPVFQKARLWLRRLEQYKGLYSGHGCIFTIHI